MNLEQIEIDIKNRLTAKLPGAIEVEILPENEKDYKKPFANCKISVCYGLSEFAKPKSTGYIVQQEDIQVELFIRGRKLRGVNQVWDAKNKALKALIGFMPTDCRRIFGVGFRIESREDGLFSYVLTLAMGSELVEDFDENDEVLQPPVNTITVNPADPGFMPGVTGNMQTNP